jgi:hypothetical protein
MSNLWVAHILPDRELIYRRMTDDGEQVIPFAFDAPAVRRDVVESMAGLLQSWSAPLVMEHTPGAFAYGYVRGVNELDGGIFALVECISADVQAKLSEPARKQYVSVGMGRDSADSTGRVWPWALWELSLVAIPAFEVGQQPIRAASAADLEAFGYTQAARTEPEPLRIAASARKQLYIFADTRHTSHTKLANQTGGRMEMEELISMVTAMQESLASCMARLDALESMGESDDDMAMDPAMMDPTEDPAELKAQLSAAERIIARPELAPIRATLVTLAKSNPGEVDRLVAAWPKATVQASKLPVVPAVAITAAPAVNVADADEAPHARALKIQASHHAAGKSTTYPEALRLAQAGVNV